MSNSIADLREVAEGFDPSLERSCSLPRRCYVEPAFERGRFFGGLSEHAVHHFPGLVPEACRRDAGAG